MLQEDPRRCQGVQDAPRGARQPAESQARAPVKETVREGKRVGRKGVVIQRCGRGGEGAGRSQGVNRQVGLWGGM